MKHFLRNAHLATFVWVFCGTPAYAQCVEQSFDLQTGWNSVYLEVDPAPNDADLLFEGLPIEAVWMRCEGHRTSPVAIDTHHPEDPAYTATTDTGWRVWFPSDAPQRAVNSLRVVRGGRVYLIEASTPTTFIVRGKPDASITRWREGYNLAGFHVVDAAASAPTFSQYLQPSEAHDDAAIYELNPDGTLSRVADHDSARITAGQGYWVQASKSSTYDGPIRIDQRSLRCVDLAPGNAEHRIHIQNLRTTPGDVHVAYQSAPGASGSESLGRAPLLRLDFVTAADSSIQARWHPLDEMTLSLEATGQPGSSRTVRVAVSRKDLADLNLDYDEDGYHHGLLCVKDGAGYRRLLPVRTRDDDQAGLWVGDVTVTDVESLTAPEQGTETASPFTFRIILHKSSDDTYTLLRDVVLLWQDDGGGGGSYILVTPDCEGLLNGQSVAPRISTANFSFDTTVSLSGDFQTQLEGTITLTPDHPLDPYRHVYHPEHANGFTGGVARVLTFIFDGDGGGDPEWGVTRLGGSYVENITGMHREMIQVNGQFEIRRISDIASLCGQ